MAPDRRSDPFTRSYQAIRKELTAGIARPGDQIVVVETARCLGVSPTPVREALARLAGERLVEDHRRHGYFVPLPSWFELVELYDLCELHILAAVREADRARVVPLSFGGPAVPGSEVPGDTDPLLGMLASLLALSRNARLVVAGKGYVDCLRAARRTEVGLYGADAGWVMRLRDLAGSGAWKEVMQAVRQQFRTHRRRAEPVAYSLAAAHRARNRANIV